MFLNLKKVLKQKKWCYIAAGLIGEGPTMFTDRQLLVRR